MRSYSLLLLSLLLLPACSAVKSIGVARTVGQLVPTVGAVSPMVDSLAAPTAKAEVFVSDSGPQFLDVELAKIQGRQIAAMLLPEQTQQLSSMIVLKGVARSGLRVINAMDSFDAARIQAYKDQAGSGKFAIAPEDRVRFDGVQYIIIYSQISQPARGPLGHGQASGYCQNRIEMKFWHVATGELVAVCEASGTYATPNRYDGMDVEISRALIEARLPGADSASSPTSATTGQ